MASFVRNDFGGGRGRSFGGRGSGRGSGARENLIQDPTQFGGRGFGGSFSGRGNGQGFGARKDGDTSKVMNESKPKPTKEQRKEGRRKAQSAAVEHKMDSDEAYFWNCVQNSRGKSDQHTPSAQVLYAKQGASGIDFKQYDNIPVERSGPNSAHVPALGNFSLLAGVLPNFLHANLTRTDRMGYSVPTPIQKHCVPLSLSGAFDVMACAQTGSGKTVAFLVPLIAAIVQQPIKATTGGWRTPAKPSALIVAPTRELAIQIELEAQKLTYSSNLRTRVCYGGVPSREQLLQLASGVDILVATPGRLNDFLDRELISLECVRFFVLDEADRMLDMGFEPQIRQICDRYNLPAAVNRRTLMFSATFPDNMQKIAQKYMRQYVFVAVGRVGSTIESITQKLVKAARNDKRLKLELLVNLPQFTTARNGRFPKSIVFVQKKHNANWVCNELCKAHRGLRAESIHGDRSQSQREAALNAFREGRIDVLVATDVAARGLDVADVVLVVQFDLPVSKEDFDSYVHRIGRTGRAGNRGTAVAFYVPGDDAKNGENGALWEPLHTLLREAHQELPSWFMDCRPAGGRGSVGNSAATGKQPQRDVRGFAAFQDEPQTRATEQATRSVKSTPSPEPAQLTQRTERPSRKREQQAQQQEPAPVAITQPAPEVKTARERPSRKREQQAQQQEPAPVAITQPAPEVKTARERPSRKREQQAQQQEPAPVAVRVPTASDFVPASVRSQQASGKDETRNSVRGTNGGRGGRGKGREVREAL